MRKQRYIILEQPGRPAAAPPAGKRGVRGQGLEGMGSILKKDATAPELELKTDEMTAAEAAQRGKEKNVQGIVPWMPTLLIRSKPSKAAIKTNWGIDAVGAVASAFDGSGVKVAVLDTGIKQDHPAFAGIAIEQQDFTNSPSGTDDQDGHGTHCAGTIFGRDVDGIRIGVARGISEALIGKVLGDDGSGDSLALFKAVQWAAQSGANIISMSLGFDFPRMVQIAQDEDGLPLDLAVSNALVNYRLNLRAFDTLLAHLRVSEAWGGNAIIVAAAGNESRREADADFRISASLPAAADGVISVAALGMRQKRLGIADFSNSDPMISAPGIDILSASINGGLEAMNGTSQACPHVAGLAALWWQKLRDEGAKATPATVSEKLLASARPLVDEIDWVDCGRGLAVAP